MHVSTEYDEGHSPALTWQEARQKCKDFAPTGWTSDLVVLENGTKLSLLSKHVYDNYEGEDANQRGWSEVSAVSRDLGGM